MACSEARQLRLPRWIVAVVPLLALLVACGPDDKSKVIPSSDSGSQVQESTNSPSLASTGETHTYVETDLASTVSGRSTTAPFPVTRRPTSAGPPKRIIAPAPTSKPAIPPVPPPEPGSGAQGSVIVGPPSPPATSPVTVTPPVPSVSKPPTSSSTSTSGDST
jgi:hypothetical protein